MHYNRPFVTFFIVYVVITLGLAVLPSIFTLWFQSEGQIPIRPVENETPVGNQTDSVLSFVHVSDIHIMIDKDATTTYLSSFMEELSEFQPDFVLCTGDITTSLEKTGLLTPRSSLHSQHVEWRIYNETLGNISVPWFDIRGNHDNYNVINRFDADENYYLKYGVSPNLGYSPDLYSFDIAKGSSHIHVLVVDSNSVPGMVWPLGTFGYISHRIIGDMLHDLENADHSALVTLAQHHPRSSIITREVDYDQFVSNFDASFVGHLHTIDTTFRFERDSIPYSSVEIEAPPLKNAQFRINTVDHGILSSMEYDIYTFPKTIVTMPPSRQLLMRTQPLYRMQSSTHFRVLSYSKQGCAVTAVVGHIKNQTISFEKLGPIGFNGGNNGDMYAALHPVNMDRRGVLIVTSTDSCGNSHTFKHSFDFDGWTQRVPINFGRIVLNADFPGVAHTMFWLGVVIAVFTAIAGPLTSAFSKRMQLRRLIRNRNRSASIEANSLIVQRLLDNPGTPIPEQKKDDNKNLKSIRKLKKALRFRLLPRRVFITFVIWLIIFCSGYICMGRVFAGKWAVVTFWGVYRWGARARALFISLASILLLFMVYVPVTWSTYMRVIVARSQYSSSLSMVTGRFKRIFEGKISYYVMDCFAIFGFLVSTSLLLFSFGWKEYLTSAVPYFFCSAIYIRYHYCVKNLPITHDVLLENEKTHLLRDDNEEEGAILIHTSVVPEDNFV
ncbi:hypothetical protein PCE1_001547 [Barthelona sp. PCE]